MSILSLLSDVLLFAATVALAVYCWGASKRRPVSEVPDADASAEIAALAAQVDEMHAALAVDRSDRDTQIAQLRQATERAEDSIGQLEMLIAAAEDVAMASADRSSPDPLAAPPPVRSPATAMPRFRQARVGAGAAE
jgi:hypothetical protein